MIKVSYLNDEEKSAANKVKDKIDSFKRIFYANNCAPQREKELDLLILGQQTYQELLDEGTEVGLDTVLDLNIK